MVGLESVDIGDTIADFDNPVALPPITVDEPTLDMIFRINDSPFVGQDGTYVTSRQLRDRLMKELESNVALRVTPDEVKRDEFHVAGRGLLHLWILLENMRREGYELSVGKPRVITKEVNGETMEPIEYLVIEVPPALGRGGDGAGRQPPGGVREDGRARRPDAHRVHHPGPRPDRPAHAADDGDERRGDHAPQLLRLPAAARQHPGAHQRRDGLDGDRPGDAVRPGQSAGARHRCSSAAASRSTRGRSCGEHCRDNDLPVNVCREKKLTNMRASGTDKAIILKPPRQMTLELALEYIEDDELVEVTPKAIRLRKIYLKENDRKKFARQAAAAAAE